MRVIIPRECPDPRTDHCIGLPPEFPETGPTRCDFCGRFMPLDEAIDFGEDGTCFARGDCNCAISCHERNLT